MKKGSITNIAIAVVAVLAIVFIVKNVSAQTGGARARCGNPCRKACKAAYADNPEAFGDCKRRWALACKQREHCLTSDGKLTDDFKELLDEYKTVRFNGKALGALRDPQYSYTSNRISDEHLSQVFDMLAKSNIPLVEPGRWLWSVNMNGAVRRGRVNVFRDNIDKFEEGLRRTIYRTSANYADLAVSPGDGVITIEPN